MPPNWTEQEIEFLSDKAGWLTYDQIAQKIGRSAWAVELQAHRLGCSYSNNYYSYTTLSEELGFTRTAIRKWVKKGLLKGQLANFKRAYGNRPMMFRQAEIDKFLKNNASKFRNRLIPNMWFRNIVKENLKKF